MISKLNFVFSMLSSETYFTATCKIYWNSIRLEMRLHKQNHIHKGI